MKEIAANCHHSNRVREVKGEEQGLLDVFSSGTKLARGPVEVARVALAPIDPTLSWADNSPKNACVSNIASGNGLLVSCSG